jgi:hypothetical protein
MKFKGTKLKKFAIHRSQLRPAFREAMDEVLNEHAELLQRLAK